MATDAGQLPSHVFPAVYHYLLSQGLSQSAKILVDEWTRAFGKAPSLDSPDRSLTDVYASHHESCKRKASDEPDEAPAAKKAQDTGHKKAAPPAAAPLPAPVPAKSAKASTGTGNTPFRRVDPDKITFDKEGLGDNSWDYLRAKGHTYADKAQERLGPVKGKAFQKQMTKAKRGTYRGGAIDNGAVNSIKF